jgi:hypothetical protein
MTPEPFLHFRVYHDGTPLGVAMASTPEEACAFVRMRVPGAETGELRAERVDHPDDGWFARTAPHGDGVMVWVTTQTAHGRRVDWHWIPLELDRKVVAWRVGVTGQKYPAATRPEPFSCGPVWVPEPRP